MQLNSVQTAAVLAFCGIATAQNTQNGQVNGQVSGQGNIVAQGAAGANGNGAGAAAGAGSNIAILQGMPSSPRSCLKGSTK